MTAADWRTIIDALVPPYDDDWYGAEREEHFHTRIAYADWLEENGDSSRARAQRYMADNAKCPLEQFPSKDWTWDCGDVFFFKIPEPLFKHLEAVGGEPRDDGGFLPEMVFPTRAAAEDALAAAMDLADEDIIG